MKLSSFKRFKLAGIVICMLAAGICYSCSGPSVTQDGVVLELEEAEGQDREVSYGEEPEPYKETAGGGSMELDEGKAVAGETGVQPVFVHICGQVKAPGVYELPEGSRVHEAVEAAGGFTGEAAGDYLNLAQEVQDGMKLEIPNREQAEEWQNQGQPGIGVSGSQGALEGDGAKVNINTASREELMSLSGIGESRAEDIIRYRDKFGGFESPEDIMNVSGIKEAAFEKIKDSITV